MKESEKKWNVLDNNHFSLQHLRSVFNLGHYFAWNIQLIIPLSHCLLATGTVDCHFPTMSKFLPVVLELCLIIDSLKNSKFFLLLSLFTFKNRYGLVFNGCFIFIICLISKCLTEMKNWLKLSPFRYMKVYRLV